MCGIYQYATKPHVRNSWPQIKLVLLSTCSHGLHAHRAYRFSNGLFLNSWSISSVIQVHTHIHKQTQCLVPVPLPSPCWPHFPDILLMSVFWHTIDVRFLQYYRHQFSDVIKTSIPAQHLTKTWHHILTTFWRRIDQMLPTGTAPISLFDWQKFLFGTFEWSCGSKTAVLTIFCHLMIINYDLWTSNFQ